VKAIILASGTGSRLKPLTDKLPKTLLNLGRKTILDYQLLALEKHGIRDIIITTGPFREKIEEHVHNNHHHLDVTFVHNPRYDSTNYIYSLWLTGNLIDSDILLLHADLLFDDLLVRQLMQAAGNYVLVDKNVEPPEKDFKALVENDIVTRIGVDVSGKNAFFCAPMYRLTQGGFKIWLGEMAKFIRDNKVDCYAEDAFNQVAGKIALRPLYFDKFCMEIDTHKDLERARFVQSYDGVTLGHLG